MNAGALARERHPVAALAKGKVVRELGEVGVGVEALDCGFYLLDFGRSWGSGIVYKGLGRGIRLSI